ncbi:histidine phosphatase superfamily [Cunninghamella echinulata]|nr:histidine phosphatase superfamily [Cunninghamella echinulata]
MRILQGQTDTILNDLGHKQAILVGERFSKESFNKIYCSDLKRCKQTAAAIQLHHNTTPVSYVPELRERGFGELSGQSISAIFRKSDGNKYTNVNDYIKEHGGETDKEFNERVINAYKDIIEDAHQNKYQHILIVTHGGPLRSLCFWFVTSPIVTYQYNEQEANVIKQGRHGNTGVSQVVIFNGDPKNGCIKLFSCSDHLNSLGSDNYIPPSV